MNSQWQHETPEGDRSHPFGEVNLTTRSLNRDIGLPALPGFFYAVRIPREQLDSLAENQNLLIQGATFNTAPIKFASVPIFARALITTGEVKPDNTAAVNVDQPLVEVKNFVGQDRDFTPLYLDNLIEVTETIRTGLQQNTIDSLFLVLQFPVEPTPPETEPEIPQLGLDGFIEGLIDDNDDVPALGLSFISSDDGRTFIPAAEFIRQHTLAVGDFNIMFGLILSEVPGASFVLSVDKAGDGQGQVVSEPEGIDCGPACSHAFAANTDIQLTAIPDVGTEFAGWVAHDARCLEIDACIVTLDRRKQVTALFTQDLRLLKFAVSATIPGDVGDEVSVEVVGADQFTPQTIELPSLNQPQIFHTLVPPNVLIQICLTSVDLGVTPNTFFRIEALSPLRPGIPSSRGGALGEVGQKACLDVFVN